VNTGHCSGDLHDLSCKRFRLRSLLDMAEGEGSICCQKKGGF
jgi:hypothetical protein